MKLEWREGESVEVLSAAELSAALDAIEGDEERTEPVLAFLKGPAAFLTIGVGHPTVSLLMHGSSSPDSPVRHAVGDPRARAANEDQPFLAFTSYGRRYEFSKWMGIAPDRAREVACHFLQSGGQLSDAVMWEEERVPPSSPTGVAAPSR